MLEKHQTEKWDPGIITAKFASFANTQEEKGSLTAYVSPFLKIKQETLSKQEFTQLPREASMCCIINHSVEKSIAIIETSSCWGFGEPPYMWWEGRHFWAFQLTGPNLHLGLHYFCKGGRSLGKDSDLGHRPENFQVYPFNHLLPHSAWWGKGISQDPVAIPNGKRSVFFHFGGA